MKKIFFIVIALLIGMGTIEAQNRRGTSWTLDSLITTILRVNGKLIGSGAYLSDTSQFFLKSGGRIIDVGASSSVGLVRLTTNGGFQLVLEDSDAANDKVPFWYFQSANNGSKGILYLGYANRTGTSLTGSTDRMIMDSASVTFGASIGVGSMAVIAGAGSFSSLGSTTITGSFTATDSTTAPILKSQDGIKWKMRVDNAGGVHADSTGLN